MKNRPVADTAVLFRAYNYRGDSPDDLVREIVYEAYELETGRLLTVGREPYCRRYLGELGYQIIPDPSLVLFQRDLLQTAFPEGCSTFIGRIPTAILARLIKTYCRRGGKQTTWYETEDAVTRVGIAWGKSRCEVVAKTRRRGYQIPAADLVDPLVKLIFS